MYLMAFSFHCSEVSARLWLRGAGMGEQGGRCATVNRCRTSRAAGCAYADTCAVGVTARRDVGCSPQVCGCGFIPV